MFDWLFGKGRETDYKGTMDQFKQAETARKTAQDFYSKNIDGKWDEMDPGMQGQIANQYNQLNSQSDNVMNQYNGMLDAYNQEEKSTQHDYFGNGMLGTLLNPIGQTATAGLDLMTGNYENNGRDVMSDLGAVGETALSALPFAGGAMKAAKMGKAGAAFNKGINSVPGWAAMGAGFGGADALREGGSDTQLGDVLSGMGSGAAFSAAIPIAGKVGGKMLRGRGSKVLSREMGKTDMDPEMIQQAMSAVPNKALYQEAMKSFVPKSTAGKIGLGGAGLFGASQMMGGGQPEAPIDPMLMQQLQQGAQTPMYEDGSGGEEPSEEEIMNYLIEMGLI